MSERVAFFMPSFRGGGAERVMMTLAAGFAARGLAAEVLVAQCEGPNQPPPASGIRVVDLKARRVVLALKGLADFLRAEPPAAMLSGTPSRAQPGIVRRRTPMIASRTASTTRFGMTPVRQNSTRGAG